VLDRSDPLGERANRREARRDRRLRRPGRCADLAIGSLQTRSGL